MSENRKKKIVILGGGESGVGAAILAQKKGYDVFLTDKGSISEKYQDMLKAHHIPFEEKQHTESHILEADEVIKSPGIPDHIPIIQKIIEKKIPIISEIEWGSRYTQAPIIAITGTNGKTTTTSLVYHLLKTAGLNVALGGNIGDSFAKQVAEKEPDYWVLEVSSFQLDNCYQFKPFISILLNITPDHLDRYDYQMQKYIDAKLRIAQCQNESDFFIYNAENEAIIGNLPTRKINPTHLPVSLYNKEESTAYLHNDTLYAFFKNEKFQIEANKLPIQGKHNVFNALCAIQVGQIVGLSTEKLINGLATFEGVEHRLEKVAVIEGITFINDSKATNIDSVYYALGSFPDQKAHIIWIVGGIDKGNDYSLLDEFVFEKVKKIIALGKDNTKIKAYYHDQLPLTETQSIEEAVKQAFQEAESGDIVLLSPACASFDLFKNYEDRGKQFKEAVALISI